MGKEIEVTIITADGSREVVLGCKGCLLEALLEENGYVSNGKLEESALRKVEIVGDAAATPLEERNLTPEEIAGGVRLVNLFKIQSPVKVQLNPGYKKDPVGVMPDWAVLAAGLPWHYENVYLPGRQGELPEVMDQYPALYDRMAAALPGYTLRPDPKQIRELAFLDRVGRPVIELKALLDERTKTVLQIARQEEPLLGMAVSLDAETVTLLLVNLQDGSLLEQLTETGAIFEKLTEASRQRERAENLFESLHTAACEQIQRMANELLERQKVKPENVLRTVVLGQTPPLHILLGIPPQDVSNPGLHALFYAEMPLDAAGQTPAMNPKGDYILLQQMTHMVGSDALAAAWALRETNGVPLLMIQPAAGGQVMLQQGEKLWATPAFHGTPDVSILQQIVGNVLAEAGLQMEDLGRVAVLMPFTQALPPVKDKMRRLFSRIAPEKVRYISAPHFTGARAALLSDDVCRALREICARVTFAG